MHGFAMGENTAQEGEEGRGSSFSSLGGTSFYLFWLTVLSLYCLGAVSLHSWHFGLTELSLSMEQLPGETGRTHW